MAFFETSAKTGLNIKEVFESIARDIIKNKPASAARATTKLVNKSEEKKKEEGGCGC